MAKQTPAAVNLKNFNERVGFHKLIAKNPNYFGNFSGTEFKPVLALSNDTFYEELTCVAFNPDLNQLEAVIQVKQETGYAGDDCSSGSFEYIRFYVDYGTGFEDAGLVAVNVHDIPEATDCAKNPEKPLSYSASLQIAPKTNDCDDPVLPNVRAILSWQSIPPAGNPNWTPIWGNHLDSHVQIKPGQADFADLIEDLFEDLKIKLPPLPPKYQAVANIPIPLPDPPPIDLPGLVKLYGGSAPKAAGVKAAASVPAHRYGFPEIQKVISSPTVSSQAVLSKINLFKSAGIDWNAVIAALDGIDADVSYEQLECLALEGNLGLERLVATIRIKQAVGYSGDLCSAGSYEYVAFWADWDDTCQYTYLGTVAVNVHDIAATPALGGLCYSAVLPVDLSQHRNTCDKPKIARVRAVLSWAVPPSTVDPNALTTWGNLIDTHVQIRPGSAPNPLNPTISILGGIPTSMIDGSGLTTTGLNSARFAGNNLLADSAAQAAGQPARPCPFGGIVEVQGPEFFGYRYRIQVRNLTAGGSWQDVATPLLLTRANGTTYMSFPDAQNFFLYQQYPDNIENLLGNWDSSGDDQWQVKLEIADLSDNPVPGAIPDLHVIQLDNTAPEAAVHIDSGGDCGKFAVGTVLQGHFVARDANFGAYSLGTLPFAGPISPNGGLVQTAVAPGDPWTLDTTNMTPCGYVIEVDVEDRSIVNSAWGAHNPASNAAGFCLLKTL
jgi:hypothetical protein